MIVYRTISTAFFITILAVSYVHQRVEIIKLGYDMQDNKRYLADLVDQNSKLMYNLSKLESPRSLLTPLDTEKIKFASQRNAHPDNYIVGETEAKGPNRVESFVGNVLDTLSTRAEAKPRS